MLLSSQGIRTGGAAVELLESAWVLLALHLGLPAPSERQHVRLFGQAGTLLRGHALGHDRVGVLESVRWRDRAQPRTRGAARRTTSPVEPNSCFRAEKIAPDHPALAALGIVESR